MSERIRTTISISPEALEVFKRMAAAANMSVSRAMGDWLMDTSDAAEMITVKMEDAKKAPMRVMRELKAMVAGMDGELETVMNGLRERRADTPNAPPERERRRSGSEYVPAIPPSSNTGGKSPKTLAPKAVKGRK